MRNSSLLALCLFLAVFLTQSEAIIVDPDFKQLCPTANETTYHVNIALSCKVYYICRRGNFVDFQRCPEQKTFSQVTNRCDFNIPCPHNTTVETPLQIFFSRESVLKLIDSLNRILVEHVNWTKTQYLNKVSTSPGRSVSFINHTDSSAMTGISSISSQESQPNKSFPTREASMVSRKVSTSSNEKPTIVFNKEKAEPTRMDITGTIGDSKRNDAMNLEQDTDATSNGTKPFNFLYSLIVPTAREILNDPSQTSRVTLLFRTIFEALVPLANQVLNQSKEDALPGSTINISKKDYKDAVSKIRAHSHPTLREMLLAKLPSILERAADNVPQLMYSIREVKNRLKPHAKELFQASVSLLRKYSNVAKTSSAEYFNTYSLKEIQSDIEPLMKILYDVFQEDVQDSFQQKQNLSDISKPLQE